MAAMTILCVEIQNQVRIMPMEKTAQVECENKTLWWEEEGSSGNCSRYKQVWRSEILLQKSLLKFFLKMHKCKPLNSVVYEVPNSL